MVKSLAEKHDLRATFMPKPFSNLTGNGCHAHISLWNGKTNKFLDNNDKLGLTKLAYNFLGGIMHLAQPLSAFFNPTINSYRRINAPPTKSGASWSPSSISYTGNNRTHMIRVPDAGRFELRLMDGSSNPYLLQAGVIAAGLHGLNNRIDPGEPLSCNMYTEYKNYPNLKKLPDTIEDALDFLENSKEIKEAFGENTIKSYLKLKKSEIINFDQEETFNKKDPVTNWEKNNSLDC
jgi:glutamate---methylamine ligase